MRPCRRFALRFALLALVGVAIVCASARPVGASRSGAPLEVTYRGPARVHTGTAAEVKLTITNRGSTPAELNLFVLAIPQLALDVRDAHGQLVPPEPPPMPPEHMDTAMLDPGAARTFTLSLDAFSPPLPP